MNSLILYVNSRNRIDTPGSTDTNFFYYFKELVNSTITYTKVSLLSISIPKTYYLVNENSFLVHEGDVTKEFSMPHGNYNIKSFARVLSTLISGGNSPHGFVYNVYTDVTSQLTQPTTGKYTYTIQGNSAQISVLIEVHNTLFEQFGFNRNSVNHFIDNKLVSTNVCNMNRESTLFLHSDMVQNRNENILHEIYATEVESGSFITYNNKVPHLTAKNLANQKGSPSFQLTNEDGEFIDLNGLNLNFTLLLT